MDKIAVIIPCYNKAQTIEKVITDYKNALPDAAIYVYDNNSTDATVKVASNAGAIVRHEYQQGKGNVIRRMFREIDVECYLMVDGDDTYLAESAPEIVKCILEQNVDMVIGDRLSSTYFQENKRPFHNWGNNLVRKSINALFHTEIKDVMTGYRAFSYLFVKSFPVLSRGFEIETEMTIHAIDKNMSTRNVIVEYRDRPSGSTSKLNTVPDGIKVLRTIGRLYKNYKSLAFFSLLARILMLIGMILFVPILLTYFKTGLVPKFPTLIMCCCIMIAALESFFTGLMLSTMAEKDRQDFEKNLQFVEWKREAESNCQN